MKQFKLLTMVVAIGVFATATLLGSGAQAAGGDHPFPWPRAVCPISWQDLGGRYRVEAIANPGAFEDHFLVVVVRPSQSRAGDVYVQLLEYTPSHSLFAQGNTYAPMSTRSVRAVLSQENSPTKYIVEMRAYRRRLHDRCDSSHVILAISYCPMNGNQCQSGPAYELVRTGR